MKNLKNLKAKNMDIKIKGDTIVSDKFEAKIKNRLSSMKR